MRTMESPQKEIRDESRVENHTGMSNSAPHKILFVDDDQLILTALTRLSRRKNWTATTTDSAEKALELLKTEEFDVVVSDMRMPKMSGDEFLSNVKENYPNTVRVLLTGYSDISAVQSAINGAKIFNYITKPWDEAQLNTTLEEACYEAERLKNSEKHIEDSSRNNQKLSRLALLLDRKVKEKTIEVDQALGLLENLQQRAGKEFYDSLNVVTSMLEWKEGRDSGHANFVAEYGEKILISLNAKPDEIEDLKLAATLHRIGTLYLVDELNLRPVFSFDFAERRQYQQYPAWGELALANADGLKWVAKIVRHHRENVDGTGYPDKLTGDEIPLISKIIAVLGDFYDISNGRLERNLSGSMDAMEYIQKWAGKKYDKNLVETFLSVLGEFSEHESKKQSVKTSELTEGMVLDSDIRDKNNILLLKQGVKINDSHIKHLQDYETANKEEFNIRALAES